MRKFFEIGGVVAAAVLIAFGIAAIVRGLNGQSDVNDSLKQGEVVGSADLAKQIEEMGPFRLVGDPKAEQLPLVAFQLAEERNRRLLDQLIFRIASHPMVTPSSWGVGITPSLGGVGKGPFHQPGSVWHFSTGVFNPRRMEAGNPGVDRR